MRSKHKAVGYHIAALGLVHTASQRQRRGHVRVRG